MSKTKLNKKSLKIIGATSIVLFSLVTVFTATIAWFSMNSRVNGSGMNVKIKIDSGRLNKIEIYEYVETIDKGTETNHDYNYSFKDTPSAVIYGGSESDNASYQMGNFDPLSTEHPILILFTLVDDFVSEYPGDMYIKGLTEADGFLGTTVDGQPKYKLGSSAPTLKRGTKTASVYDPLIDGYVTKTFDCYPLSSAVSFKGAEFSSDEYDDLIGESTEQRIDIPTNSIAKKESFVNFATSGEGITFKKNPTIFSSQGTGETIKYIALIVNYDEDAITAIYSTYLGDTTLEQEYEGRLFFTCDWSLEVL